MNLDKTMRQGAGAPSFCWVCNRQLMRAKGKGLGLFYFDIVRDRDGIEHRVHRAACLESAKQDGLKYVSSKEPK